jgi:hypothetical protein
LVEVEEQLLEHDLIVGKGTQGLSKVYAGLSKPFKITMFESWGTASSGDKAGTYQPRGSLETMANLPVAWPNEKMVYISS